MTKAEELREIAHQFNDAELNSLYSEIVNFCETLAKIGKYSCHYLIDEQKYDQIKHILESNGFGVIVNNEHDFVYDPDYQTVILISW